MLGSVNYMLHGIGLWLLVETQLGVLHVALLEKELELGFGLLVRQEVFQYTALHEVGHLR